RADAVIGVKLAGGATGNASCSASGASRHHPAAASTVAREHGRRAVLRRTLLRMVHTDDEVITSARRGHVQQTLRLVTLGVGGLVGERLVPRRGEPALPRAHR